MSLGSVFVMVEQQYQPSLLFCAGLFVSVVCCVISLIVESKFRRRDFNRMLPSRRELSYRRFLPELNSSPRHIGFAGGEVYDLDDRDFPSKSK
ncbi:MAG: hypothetical protein WCH39_28985 [Schlesneria sp.]